VLFAGLGRSTERISIVTRKALIIVENLSVPYDTRVWKEARCLRDNGYATTVLCPKGKKTEEGYECLEGVHIYRHPMPRELGGALGYLWEYGWALFWEVLFSWWIFLRRGFHVIQGCNPPDDIFLVALPFKLFGVKYIFDQHDANPELYLSKYGRKGLLYRVQVWLERVTYRCADVVMSTNESFKNLAISRGHCDSSNVFVVRNGPDLQTFKAVAPIEALKYGKIYLVGYVGNMGDQDGLDILLAVALHIKEAGRNDIHFTCVGGGPALPELRKMAADQGLDEMVNFTGRLVGQPLLEILSTADVCVSPDTPCEVNNISTMIKIMEYMALGKPIVQFDLKEGRFSAGEASLYANNDDMVPDFAAKIMWLMDHAEERKRMGEFGRKRVERELAWEYSAKNLLAAYELAFSGKARE
jgi:glycosyltransferase involved in cell wall biosynthesis